MKDLPPPPRSSMYKRMDTIKQWDQTNRFICVCEPRDRHKRHRQWQRGEMKRRKACFSGSRVPWQELHCRLWANDSFLTRRQEGKDVALFSVCITLHIYCMIVLTPTCVASTVVKYTSFILFLPQIDKASNHFSALLLVTLKFSDQKSGNHCDSSIISLHCWSLSSQFTA